MIKSEYYIDFLKKYFIQKNLLTILKKTDHNGNGASVDIDTMAQIICSTRCPVESTRRLVENFYWTSSRATRRPIEILLDV